MINSITLYGQSYVNWFWAINGEFTGAQKTQMINPCYEPTWDEQTTLLANFNNSLNAGNAAFVPSDLKQWAVYKKSSDSPTLQLAAIIPANLNIFTDYNVKNNTSYTYYLYPETENSVGTPIVSKEITTKFQSWSLSVLEETNKKNQYTVSETFLIDFNVQADSLSNNSESAVFQNFTKYPKVQKPHSNYMSGTLSFSQGYFNANRDMIDTAELMNRFRNLSNDGKKKILKDRKGNAWLVDITSSVIYSMENTSANQPTRVNLTWTEIGDLSNIAIYNTERDFIWILENTDEVAPSLWTDNIYDEWTSSATWNP